MPNAPTSEGLVDFFLFLVGHGVPRGVYDHGQGYSDDPVEPEPPRNHFLGACGLKVEEACAK
jgi:hypothetical protein